MSTKLSFRAKNLEAGKPMPIFMAEELPDLPDYSAINRAVPQMPSGMEKEEECEHHLQRAICAGLIIPTPEVSDIPQKEFYDKVYPANYKQPRQLIHLQPFTMEQDIPDYDMDSEDERWLQSQTQRLELSPLKFEEMMDILEKSSGQTVVTLNEAKALLKEDDDLIIAVFDYWLNKRLKTQHPLILTVKTEHRAGSAANNPYIAFRRRTDKMQTRKNRKNDEVSYEKMLKLRRDIYRAVTLLELVKRREKMKREHVHLTVEIFEKRYQAKDFSGSVFNEAAASARHAAAAAASSMMTSSGAAGSAAAAHASSRPAFTPIFHNHYTNQSWVNKSTLKEEGLPRKEKRQYKKRKHKSLGRGGVASGHGAESGVVSSDDEQAGVANASPEPGDEAEEEGQFAFRRNKLCSYHMPLPTLGNWPWCSGAENGAGDKRYRFNLTSITSVINNNSNNDDSGGGKRASRRRRCVGLARRRVGRGGRVILDRASTANDDEFWRTLDFTITDDERLLSASEKFSTSLVVAGDATTTTTTAFAGLRNNLRSSSSSSLSDRPTKVGGGDDDDYDDSKRRTLNESGGAVVVVKTEVKAEPMDLYSEMGVSPLDESFGGTTTTTTNNADGGGVAKAYTKEEEGQVLEFLQAVRTDWLHFRPRTPPPDLEPLCNLQPIEDTFWKPGSTSPFSMEIQTLDAEGSLLPDASASFLADPFFDDDVVAATTTNCDDVGIHDDEEIVHHHHHHRRTTTGLNLNVNVGIDTIAPSSSSSSRNYAVVNNHVDDVNNDDISDVIDAERNDSGSSWNSAFFHGSGCSSSTFRVSDVGGSSSSSSSRGVACSHEGRGEDTPLARALLGARKSRNGGRGNVNNCNNNNNSCVVLGGGGGGRGGARTVRKEGGTMTTAMARPEEVKEEGNAMMATEGCANSLIGSTNGILPQYGYEKSTVRTKNNKLSYAYSGGMEFTNANNPGISLHTSAHTLTLNSHSANIFEIPISNNTDTVSTDLVNSPCTETSGTSSNNKNKTMVRKNNMVMEVT